MFLKGSVFENLPALQEVHLTGNECIDERFESEEEIRGLSKTVNGTCGFGKNGTQITCEKIAVFAMPESANRFFTCESTSYTTIKDNSYTITDHFNSRLIAMNFSDNRNIEFLPISPHHIFPYIRWYRAARCSIKEISKTNFEGLRYLSYIKLQENQIYAVLSDTFKGLDGLGELDLSEFWLLCLTVA